MRKEKTRAHFKNALRPTPGRRDSLAFCLMVALDPGLLLLEMSLGTPEQVTQSSADIETAHIGAYLALNDVYKTFPR